MAFDETAPLASVRRAITVKDSQRQGLVAQIPVCDARDFLHADPCVATDVGARGLQLR